ncbi:MAG TPA: tRNA (adenosine(37)-N6)-threonylcarbamoyltransferase complex transferase subunit TsaD [Thermoanaerobaculia bacterium]|nr:tRNA (adenosine(37)-N6)-threonylcarbamoyltransferase complex transferase subunit TsaD [Thermoanaerobaculia bacterium]
MNILGIETSCDETSVAVVGEDGTVRSNLIASQIARHRPFGGVVPEIASREHLEKIMLLLRQALDEAGCDLADLEGIAVTAGPGLIGALLVGVAAAQGVSYGSGLPLVPVNHLEGHIFSPWLRAEGSAIPRPARFLSLVVSGGHSSLYDVAGGRVRMLNRTRDDAGGEVFDKVAKFIGLPYPGGPQVERVGQAGDPERFSFSMPQFKDDSADFSFSGLKSTAIRLARELRIEGSAEESEIIADFCASFQKAVGDQILDRLTRIWNSLDSAEMPAELGFGGGVAANGDLRERIARWCEERGLTARLAERRYCTDNAAMIAFAGWQRWDRREGDPRVVRAFSRLPAGVETFSGADRPSQ